MLRRSQLLVPGVQVSQFMVDDACAPVEGLMNSLLVPYGILQPRDATCFYVKASILGWVAQPWCFLSGHSSHESPPTLRHCFFKLMAFQCDSVLWIVGCAEAAMCC